MVVERPDADLGVAPDLLERRRDRTVGGKPAARRSQQPLPRLRWHEEYSTATEDSSVNGLSEGALPGDVPADDERLDLGGSFVGDQGFHVAQVAHDMEVEQDAVAA
jgi:hypothetical protein